MLQLVADGLSLPEVAAVLGDRMDDLLDPAGYLGANDVWIDRALAAHRRISARPLGFSTR